MAPRSSSIGVLFVALSSLAALACAPAAEADESETTDEGALFGFGEKKTSVFIGRAVISDGLLTAAVANAQKTIGSKRDPELSGGLVLFSGAIFENVQYGIICTPRDNTCVVRWLARDRTSASEKPIAFAGELGKRIASTLKSGLEGHAAIVTCSAHGCGLSIPGLPENEATFEEISVDESAVRKFAGL